MLTVFLASDDPRTSWSFQSLMNELLIKRVGLSISVDSR
jgi:hypothetical protein